VKFENSEAGVYKDRHWRHARGWFSYQLNDPEKAAKTLRVTYNGNDSGRNFDILINNELLATVNLKAEYGDRFVDVDYPIPAQMIAKNRKGKMEVMFRAHQNSMAGGVFMVRLLSE
jgi:hypothetical protein